jgi:hypothetical protein
MKPATPRRRLLLFLPVGTRRSRRIFVLAHYAVAAGLIAITTWALPTRWSFLLLLLIPVLSLFFSLPGKIRPDGSLRSTPGFFLLRPAARRGTTALHLTNDGNAAAAIHDRFDERDRARRDSAHFVAHSYLTLALIPFLVAVTVAYADRSLWLFPVAFTGASILFILAITLPQAILLWTELDPAPETSATPTSLAGAAQ